MHCTVVAPAIARIEAVGDRYPVLTPQTKTKYSDKTRERRKDLKELALKYCRCSDTKQIKQRLKKLNIHLDLRLTAAWRAIVNELQWVINGESMPGSDIIYKVEGTNQATEPEKRKVPSFFKPSPEVLASKPTHFANDFDAMTWYINAWNPPVSDNNALTS